MPENGTQTILVIGAGPSGLAFALACVQAGIEVHIIDKRNCRSLVGKATGVSQQTWRQLESFGILLDDIEDAIAMRRFVFFDDDYEVADLSVPNVQDSPPAHLYPQGLLEERMEKTLNSYGVQVEYGTDFELIEQANDEAIVKLSNSTTQIETLCRFSWIVAADGAHSKMREVLGIPFIGKDYPECWSVAEIETTQWAESVQAKLYLQSNGVGLFLSQPAKGVVQGILNATGVAKLLQAKFSDVSLNYQREFRVSLRRVLTPRHGRIWLIGDAAHVQSPVGGQGLNLAIWDGITLANALKMNDLSVAKRLTNRAKWILRFTDFDYRMLASKNRVLRLVRNQYWTMASKHPFIAKWFFKLISGVW